jgi:hypothetical protein
MRFARFTIYFLLIQISIFVPENGATDTLIFNPQRVLGQNFPYK